MEALNIAYVGVAALLAVALQVMLLVRYRSICQSFAEDEGWHRMWHERIMDESSGHDPT